MKKHPVFGRYAFLALICFLAFHATAIATSATTYRGDIKNKVFHISSCRDYECKYCIEIFTSRETAIKMGYKPCELCKP